MNGYGFPGPLQLFRVKIHGTEKLSGIHRQSIHNLVLVIHLQTPFPAQPCQHLHIGGGIMASVGENKLRRIIVLQKSLEQRKFGAAGQQACLNTLITFKTGKCLVFQIGIQRLYNLHIRIHIHTAHFQQGHQPHIIRHKRPPARFVSLVNISGSRRKIEIGFIPLHNLVIRTELLPAGNALFRQRRLRFPAKPAVMDDFWDTHCVSPLPVSLRTRRRIPARGQ